MSRREILLCFDYTIIIKLMLKKYSAMQADLHSPALAGINNV